MAASRKGSAGKSKSSKSHARPVKRAKVATASTARRPAAKAAVHKPAAKTKPKPAAAAAKRPAAPSHAVAAKKPGKVRVVPLTATRAAHVAPAAGKGAVAKGSGRKSAGPETVRPIGMLPPEAVARATHRPAPKAVAKPAPPVRREPQRTERPTPPNEGAQRVTEKDLKEFEERLLGERRKILKEMGHLETTVLKVNQRDSSGDLSGYSFHMADAGTDAMEREKAFQFASAEGRMLMEIDAALRRLYGGEYGVCETCGDPIARARLEVMPHARLCIRCKEKEERARRGGQ
jgi:RNA polymerase-binding protein DksA